MYTHIIFISPHIWSSILVYQHFIDLIQTNTTCLYFLLATLGQHQKQNWWSIYNVMKWNKLMLFPSSSPSHTHTHTHLEAIKFDISIIIISNPLWWPKLHYMASLTQLRSKWQRERVLRRRQVSSFRCLL